jgi:hypothetical protein
LPSGEIVRAANKMAEIVADYYKKYFEESLPEDIQCPHSYADAPFINSEIYEEILEVIGNLKKKT